MKTNKSIDMLVFERNKDNNIVIRFSDNSEESAKKAKKLKKLFKSQKSAKLGKK